MVVDLADGIAGNFVYFGEFRLAAGLIIQSCDDGILLEQGQCNAAFPVHL